MHWLSREMVHLGIVLVTAIGPVQNAMSQSDYPNKPIVMVLPFAPGGSSVNIIGRMVEEVLSKGLGVQILIDNKAGAAGSIGAEYVAKAKPDGYTLLFSTASLITNAALYSDLRFDPIKDFAPVSMVYTTPALYIINGSLPVNSVGDFVEYSRKSPGRIAYGSSGVGGQTHLAAQLFMDALNIQAVHVPYKGTSQAMPDLLSGRIQFFAAAPAAAMPFIKEGRIKALAVASKTRLKQLPDVPSTAETVEPNFEVGYWSGLWAPQRTAVPIVNRLHSILEKYFFSPEGMARIEAQDAIPLVSKPEDFAKFLRSDFERWSAVIKKSGIKPE